MRELGLHVFVIECDVDEIDLLDAEALSYATWYYNNDFSDDFKEVINKI